MNTEIIDALKKIVLDLNGNPEDIELEIPKDLSHGDLSTNIALKLSKQLNKNPREIAEEIVEKLGVMSSELGVGEVAIAGPGFINFTYSREFLQKNLSEVLEKKDKFGTSSSNQNKKVMVEYAHPNTHKEMHIGHMRTLITGEALARLFEATGATVFRANYQGDIGPHVAKALYGLQKLMEDEHLSLEDIQKLPHIEKAHILGRGYARGSAEYETNKEEIDDINAALYAQDPKIWDLYKTTRQWSLEYYDDFYKQFYTKFDHLFFESEMAARGTEIVKNHTGDVFIEDDGAIIFPGKQYGLHNRVFITSKGTPTYEGKEMANAEAEFEAFPFDKKIHVVGSEQAGYFKVVFKALEMLDPEKYKDKQHHVSMGMVTFTDRKMSSRTGDVLRVDWLIDEVRKRVAEIIQDAKVNKSASDEVINQVTIGAIKYSVLKVGTGQDVSFDINQSVSLEGNSGPYLQYTYARTRSVLSKLKTQNANLKTTTQNSKDDLKLETEEENLLRMLVQYPSVVQEAATQFAPNLVANYLFELAQLFNLFYQKHKILPSPVIPAKAGISGSPIEVEDDNRITDDVISNFRLALTDATGQVIKNGLELLGIQTPSSM